MFVISFNICLFIYFSVKYAIQSNDCDVFVNKQSITYLSIYLSEIHKEKGKALFGLLQPDRTTPLPDSTLRTQSSNVMLVHVRRCSYLMHGNNVQV